MILLDDQGTGPDGHSRLYQNPCYELRAWTLDELPTLASRIEELSRQGVYWVLAVAYDLGRMLNTIGDREAISGRLNRINNSRSPLLHAAGFEGYRALSRAQASEWLAQNASLGNSQSMDEAPACGLVFEDWGQLRDAYCRAIETAQVEIAKGTFYQINLTFPFRGHYFGDPVRLYEMLRKQQRTGLSALWLSFHGAQHLLSFSPELFLRSRGGQISAQPMKGTCSSSEDPIHTLVENPKNRAENIMIVDLLRNDLGQICKTGSISAPRLLSVEQVGSLYQMTSEIAGSLRDEVGLLDVLRASFPCGSVTGAPKRKSMEWIDRLETSNRGLYCGALGWLDPPKTEANQSMGRSAMPRLGDFEWSVLIRTLVLRSDQSFEMGLGAGITIDSSPEKEWEECLSKAGFLLSIPPSLGLFETLRVERGQPLRLHLHLSRLINSCRCLGIQVTESALVESVNEALESLDDQTPHRLRIAIASNARIDVSLGPLGPTPQPTVFWAEDLLGDGMGCMQKQNPTLHHKVDRRPSYDKAWQLAESLGGFDAIFTNEDGEVTEGGRSNVFIKKDGVWLTPPLSSGLLPGIMRAELLASRDWNAKELVIYPADVNSAQEVVVCNSLRGVLKVKLNSKP